MHGSHFEIVSEKRSTYNFEYEKGYSITFCIALLESRIFGAIEQYHQCPTGNHQLSYLPPGKKGKKLQKDVSKRE